MSSLNLGNFSFLGGTSKKVTKNQLELMITFLEIHPYLLNERNGSKRYTVSKFERQRKWTDLMNILNDAVGPSKDVTDWKKTWRDWHYYTRVKATKINKYMQGSEKELKVSEYLSPLEERVLALYAKVAGRGNTEVEEGCVSDISDTPTYPPVKAGEAIWVELNPVITSTCSLYNDQQEDVDDPQVASTSMSSVDQEKEEDEEEDEYTITEKKPIAEEITSNQNYMAQNITWTTAAKEKKGEMSKSEQQFYNEKLELLKRQTIAAEKKAAAAEKKAAAAEEKARLLGKLIKLKGRKEYIKRLTADRTIRLKRLDYL